MLGAVVFRTFAIALCTTAALPMAAQAANHGFYASIDGGVVAQELSGPFTGLPLGGLLGLDTLPKPDQSPDLGWALFGAAGMRLDGPFRAEAEIGYRASTLSSVSDIDHLTVMANLLYDFPVGKNFAWSIGGGIGMDRIHWTGDGPTDSTWRFAVQGLVGASYKLSERMAIDLKYRYMVPTGADLPGLVAIRNGLSYEFTATEVRTHTLSLGLTFDLD
jgi:OOP family OmpA-OmpF porin